MWVWGQRAVLGWLMIMSLAVAATPGMAQDRSVFGMTIGARFDVPQCGPREGSYPAKTCYKLIPAEGKTRSGHEFHVFLPSAGTPAYVRGELIVTVIDGIVESVHINTWGFEAQHGAITALKRQFGEPTSTSFKAGQNASRSRYQAQSAQWDFGDFMVVFEGVTGTIDWGQIRVSTHRYLKLAAGDAKRKDHPAPKP